VIKTLLKNLALLGSAVALSLVVGEYAARFVFRDITPTAGRPERPLRPV